ncbi:response regulator transcription factor [Runella slithyformis]|uniref:Transcriptional regulator, LuxR family n=1 Tax=Runella slithyformis (strain ATCC 29530 / DSM 19594 / LMG 11500 / NCIMB 11436 / LSU 4) TaxID=761193 RepID=A0A7U3ZLX9_RUNSL|nr:response regulator transcription factor [Runella slithyformis]AEI49639.1 transcriptional regulator, LuxR family [Runella slithyformis DSM 19594]
MLKDKKILLINVEGAMRLRDYFRALQAEATMYESCTVGEIVPIPVREQADFVIIEVTHENSLEIARLFAKNAPLTRIIVLTASSQAEAVVAANVQMHALLLSGCVFDEYLTCLWQISEGYFYFSEGLQLQMARTQVKPTANLVFFDVLSGREREVLSLLCEGFTNAQIGSSLFISAETVKNHKINIMEKLHLKTNNDLLLWVGEIRKEWREHFGIK